MSGTWLALMVIQIDHFRLFQAAAGQQEADRRVSVVADAIGGQAWREGDVAARSGDAEFIVLMPETSGRDANKMAARIVAAIETRNGCRAGSGIGKHALGSVSVGVAAVSPAETGGMPAELLMAANSAMYLAKGPAKAAESADAAAEPDWVAA
jgi:diguanylate cyclase (GGDEF)-like protein